jgi:hypothetical protein
LVKYLHEEWQPKTARVRALFARAGISLPDRESWRQLRHPSGFPLFADLNLRDDRVNAGGGMVDVRDRAGGRHEEWQPKTARVRALFARAGISLPDRESWRQLRDALRISIFETIG